jgi:hypothetical protein
LFLSGGKAHATRLCNAHLILVFSSCGWLDQIEDQEGDLFCGRSRRRETPMGCAKSGSRGPDDADKK